MTKVITFSPIAVQLARSVSLDQLFPRTAVEDALRDQREQAPDSGEAALPHDVALFFAHYWVVTRAAALLLGAPGFDALARLHEQIEAEYMPGGPPMSPVYDSFAMQFVLSAVPQGIGNETPYSVLAASAAPGSVSRANQARRTEGSTAGRMPFPSCFGTPERLTGAVRREQRASRGAPLGRGRHSPSRFKKLLATF